MKDKEIVKEKIKKDWRDRDNPKDKNNVKNKENSMNKKLNNYKDRNNSTKTKTKLLIKI